MKTINQALFSVALVESIMFLGVWFTSLLLFS